MPQKYSEQGLFYMRINKLEKIHTCWGERWIVSSWSETAIFWIHDVWLGARLYWIPKYALVFWEILQKNKNENVRKFEIDESVTQ